ncbi:bifunctional phosphoribosyl-AMP cyclohydrolase/phosphoribosyl-ATP diphosphatase HisIE [Mesonia aquimarina]|uniref:bifunctional phosphoribosyl-AMP cyclohydrolase/phosphoribosyl-ATP diphosphatase HisIE n=1 Tax=Mesonia aquimarina TaxID=1504967 RepID=UPI0021CEA084|nr:bifunctional phosphoribosyl-AMP cyclohydrolase/phosphoribosyl-ATP diphosphatase HisIE [Mesonia aquimarina]
MNASVMNINFNKNKECLIPAIIQDKTTKNVLMLGYMNKEAYQKTLTTKRVCFYSRSKKRLWTKGEDSGNFLILDTIKVDCDNDALLLTVNPTGPVCHKGTDTCWGEQNKAKDDFNFINTIEKIIYNRKESYAVNSYVSGLFQKGINKIAQKLGEEAVEVVIEAKDDDIELFKNEVADLFFHLMILLEAKEVRFQDVINVLKQRHTQS